MKRSRARRGGRERASASWLGALRAPALHFRSGPLPPAGLGVLGFVACLVFLAAGGGCDGGPAAKTWPRVLVLGFDGLDPGLLEIFMARGELPSFARLAKEGSFAPLETTMPPQSPVAWSTFITGMDPGGHGIFDFVHRDPAPRGGRGPLPYLSTSKVEEGSRLEVGSYAVPTGSGEAKLLRRGTAFWNHLERAGVPTTVVKIPANFPPEPSEARTLSDMGTPDLRGTYGTFTFFTADPSDLSDEPVSGGIVRRVPETDRLDLSIEGPLDPFRSGRVRSTAPFVVFLDRSSEAVRIEIEGEVLVLGEGDWSPWVPVGFPFLVPFTGPAGMVRFHVREVSPHLRLYVSPVNLDPAAPALPISTPAGYVEDLYSRVGRFYTQGLPEDTAALNAGALTDDAFVAQADEIFRERLELFESEIRRLREGFLYVYFGGVDQVSHMFWASMEDGGGAGKIPRSHPVLRAYRQLDRVLGRALDAIEDETILLVLSDHGFAPFRRAVHLNAWLRDEGFLVLERGRTEAGELFQGVDWTRTRAYGLGLNGLYLNLHGREGRGTVSEAAREALLSEVERKLLAFRDPEGGEPVVARVYRSDETYTATHRDLAPDLVVGYARGYRVSNESALGAAPAALVEPNDKHWNGDHCIAHEEVPGVLLSNRGPIRERIGLADLAPTLLATFGIDVPAIMVGENLFLEE